MTAPKQRTFFLNGYRSMLVIADTDYSVFARLLTLVDEVVASERPVLEAGYHEAVAAMTATEEDEAVDYFDGLQEHIIDKISPLAKLETLAAELVVLGLYKKVELTRKYLMEITSEDTGGIRFSDIKVIQKVLEKRGIAHDKLADVDTVEELRLLCNAIKHTGRVSEDLAKVKHAAWIKGQPLTGLRQAIVRFEAAIPQYLRALDDALGSQVRHVTPPNI